MITYVDNPNLDLFLGVILFFVVAWFVIWIFKN